MLILKKRPFSIFTFFFIFILTLSGCNDSQDSPNAVSMKITPITQTNYDDEKTVYPLIIEFSDSAAPIKQLQQEITQGISISPALKGHWKWASDRTLIFTPTDDWPTGQQYQIKLDHNILNPNLQYAKSVTATTEFITPAFSANIEDYEFYQDPEQAHIRQSLVQLNFSHPVDREKLKKAVSINLIRKNNDNTQDIITPLGFSIRDNNEDKLRAWIVSDSVNLASSDNQYIETKINKELTALTGNNHLNEALQADVKVPTKFSLNFDSSIIYVNNHKKENNQLLSLNFNQAVKGIELEKNIQAYLLPEDLQSKNIQQLLDNSVKVDLQLIPTERIYSQTQNFQINIPQQRCLFVSIHAKITAQGGYQLPNNAGHIVCAPDYPRYIGFVGEGSLLSLNGDRLITISTQNFSKIRLDIGRIQNEQLRHIANFNIDTFQKPNLGQLKFDDISNFNTKEFNLPNAHPAKPDYVSFKLDDYTSNKRGIFWLKVEGLTDNEGSKWSSKDNSDTHQWRNDEVNQFDDYRLIILTDLGIIAKKAVDGSQAVFVQSIHSGEPVANATVKVISRNGTSVEVASTDNSGMALFPTLQNYKEELQPVMYLVEYQGDQSFLPINKFERSLDYSRFDVGGVYTFEDSLKAYLFTDRGIYRSNEDLHIGIITKAADWGIDISNIPLEIQISTPSNYTATKKTIYLAQNGLNSFDYTLPENAESGEWIAHLYITKEDEQTEIGSISFQVQDFQPDTLKIKTTFNAEQDLAWISPQDLTATVHLTNLFGTPAQNRKITANLALHSIFPKFKQYENYHFYDDQRSNAAILYKRELSEQYTDEKGETKFHLDLTQYAKNTVQMLYFSADGFETNSGRGVSNIAPVMVSSQPWLIGFQEKQDLNYVRSLSDANIHLIAINPHLEKVSVSNLTATLLERRYVSVLTQQDSGAYKYESKLIETAKSEHIVNIPENGLEYSLDTGTSGDFVLVLSNENNQEVNRIHYSVIGNSNISTNIAKNSELKLTLNKKQFQPGEEIEIAVNAPYAGSGLITIERDRVYAHKWFKADTNQSIQKILLPENFQGNGYINVQFLRDINSNEIFINPLSYGVVPFTVNLDNRRLTLNLDAPKQVKSGDTVEFKLSSNKPGKAIIYAVNEGILQVVNYQLRDPLTFFFPKYALQTSTFQILDLILPEFRKIMQFAQTGGDGYDSESAAIISAHINPFKRRIDKPVAYWSDIVDINNEKTVSYSIPEGFNGNLKIMALALSHDGQNMSTIETNTLVQDDIILSPIAPLTLTPSDQAQVSVNIANNTNYPQQIKLKLIPEAHLSILGENEKLIDVAAKSENIASFDIKATELVGATNLHFVATYHNEQKQSIDVVRNLGISVRPTLPKQIFTQISKVEAGKEANTHLPALLYPQQRQQTAIFSPAPLALSQSISAYLKNYDHYCTEQMISSAIPTLLVASNPSYKQLLNTLSDISQNNLAQANEQEIQQALSKIFTLLPSRQMEDGSYGVWNNIEGSDPFVTAYVAHFLIEAQERGIQLPSAWFGQNSLFNNTMYALETLSMPQDGDNLAILRQRAYSAYLLTRLAQVPSNALVSIRSQLEQNFKPQDWQTDLTAAWLAAAYHNLQQNTEANKLIEPVLKKVIEPRPQQWQYYYYSDPLITDSSILYIITRHFPERLDRVSDIILERINQDINNQYYNTLSSAMVLLALDAYTLNNQVSLDTLQINSNGQDIGKIESIFHFANINDEKANLNFINRSQQAAWFAINQIGYPQTSDIQNIQNGLEIHRTYTDQNGKEIKNIKIGDILNVSIKIRSTSGDLSDIVVTDLYPGGFEVIWKNEQVESEESENNIWLAQHTDLREDRMLSYGNISTETRYLNYQLRATNSGVYQIPAVYAESMYNRNIKALFTNKEIIRIEQ